MRNTIRSWMGSHALVLCCPRFSPFLVLTPGTKECAAFVPFTQFCQFKIRGPPSCVDQLNVFFWVFINPFFCSPPFLASLHRSVFPLCLLLPLHHALKRKVFPQALRESSPFYTMTSSAGGASFNWPPFPLATGVRGSGFASDSRWDS